MDMHVVQPWEDGGAVQIENLGACRVESVNGGIVSYGDDDSVAHGQGLCPASRNPDGGIA